MTVELRPSPEAEEERTGRWSAQCSPESWTFTALSRASPGSAVAFATGATEGHFRRAAR